MPLVSVLMPSYNHERFISEAIESVLSQSFNDFELIIIDDASKDESKQIIENFRKKDNRIKAIYHERNMGIARTVNDGVERAKGKFIAFFSSDDLWVKDKLKKQLEVLKRNEDLIVWSEGLIIDSEGKPTGETFTQGVPERKKSGYILEELLKGNFICGQSVILKRENLGDIRHDGQLKYLNDYKFMVDLASRYEYYFIPEPLVSYRKHGDNVANLADKEDWIKDEIVVRKYFLQKYSNKISNKVKSKLFLTMSYRYSRIGERRKARQYVYHGIKLNPFNPLNLAYLVLALTNENGVIHKFLRWCHQKYKK